MLRNGLCIRTNNPPCLILVVCESVVPDIVKVRVLHLFKWTNSQIRTPPYANKSEAQCTKNDDPMMVQSRSTQTKSTNYPKGLKQVWLQAPIRIAPKWRARRIGGILGVLGAASGTTNEWSCSWIVRRRHDEE